MLPRHTRVLGKLLNTSFVTFRARSCVQRFVDTIRQMLHVSFGLSRTRLKGEMIEASTLPVKVGCKLCRGTSSEPRMRQTVSHAQGFFKGRGLVLSMSHLSCDGNVLRHL